MATKTSSKYAWYDEKKNVVYINSKCLLPDTSGMTFRDHCRACDKAYKLSILERLELYSTPGQKEDITKFLADHEGCQLSEYSTI